MKHLKKFANTFDYNSAKLALELPNISKVIGDVAMHCNIYRPLYFKFNTASTVTIKWAYYSPTSGVNITDINYIEWSNDKGATWNKVTTPQTFTTDSGLEIWVRAKGTGINYNPDSDCLRFTPNADCTIGGNIVSLLYGDQNFSEVTLSSSPTFGSIFYNATHITDAKNLILPYKTVSSYAYYNMFYGCTSLVTAPALPATTINGNCYMEMFKNCTSLKDAPALPATTLAHNCYYSMFSGCTSLKDAPALPATTLAPYCYYSMFSGCTSLVSAPKILPATTLAKSCYANMFNGCTHLVIAPELPAETLTNYCYANMFNGCTKLNYIKALFTSIPNGAPYATGWVTGVASTGTFIRREESLDAITGVDGIPSGWDVTTDAQYKYLTFEIAEAGTIIWTRVGTSVSEKEIQYSTNNGRTWTSVTSSAAGTSLGTFNAGQRILIKGNNSAYGDINYNNYNKFDGTAKIKVYGNIMSLIYGDSFVGKTSLPSDWTFTMMFYENANLLSIKHLVLPATTLRNYCYGQMFMNCTSLTNTPEILPATTLTIDCYSGMFGGCSSLTTTPELPATTLAYHCYGWMFGKCTSLTTAPELPATTLAATCYSWMFADCSSLATAPELPATTLKTSCYYAMFARCASLTTPPVLPATTLAPYCYQAMFQSAGITVAPELPVTTLAKGCYYAMFAYCPSLATAPELPATTLVQECYQEMFYHANNLNYIKCLATDISATDCTSNWVENVSATGTFVKEIDASWTTGTSGIPTGWTTNTVIVNPETKYMTFEVVNDGTITWKANNANNTTISYSTDNGSTWTSVTSSTSGVSLGSFNAGQKVLIKGTNTAYGTSSYYNYFGGTAKVNVYGNIMSLIYGDNFTNQTTLPASYTFKYLFYGYSNLLSAEYLVLPATTLTDYCYQYMFYGCTSMITAPELPATTLANSCYESMFYGCTSMITAPELPATTLVNDCYGYMFYGCTSLATTPELPATTLADYCYDAMFAECSNLTTAPELPATTLADYCYSTMFYGCTSLVTAPELPALTLQEGCYSNMFYDCTSLVTAPELPATTLANGCYGYMFYGCKSLNNITCLATDISATDCTSDWVTNVSATGTFVRDENMSSWTIGTSGIPTGWTVNTAAAYKYMTFNVVTPGTITFTADNDTVNKTISYSTDNGSTWTSVTSSTAGTSLGTFTAGQKVLIKGTNTAYDTSEDEQSNYFGGTAQVNLTGNIMSLIYGDNFKNQITLSGTYVFSKLFYGYSNLLSAENLILPATTLPAACYANMFYGCTNLTAGPELPATTFATNCYYLMYSNTNVLPDCTNIDFTSTTVVQSGVMRGLFAGTKVTDNDLRNILPINTTTNRCYLPVTSLKNGCYVSMFEGCTSLTTAPELPATTLVETCYSGMFAGCTSLKYIKCLATDISATNCTSNWVTNVASSGTFVKNASMSSWTTTGTSGIPSGWTTLNHVDNPETKYMTFEVVNDGTITWKANNANNTKTISYSTDNGSTWKSVISSKSGVSLGTFTAGQKVLIKGTNTAYGTSSDYNYFAGAKVNVYGNIMSLIYGDNFKNQITLSGTYVFSKLFYGYSNLLSAEYLVLPATTLTDSCYHSMFRGCTSLVTAPVLPATTLADYCYNSMFHGCKSMITAPELPATTLATACYQYMFQDCISLVTAPELPATTLASYCYYSMFEGCTSLVTAPELPATTLADSCYSNMFEDCTSLVTAPELPATTLANYCYNQMFYNTNVLPDCTNIDFTSTTVVHSGGLRGLFAGTKVTDSDLQNILPINPSTGNYWLPATTLKQYCYQYMFQDCTSLVTAPELPATTLADSCYYRMFYGCTSLVTAPELPATTLANSCYQYMFQDCTSLVTAPELPATTLANSCYYRMFYGCKKLNYIKCLATNISATSCTNNWVTDVALSGTFVKNASMSSWTTGTSGIPSGWTVQDAA